MYRVLIADDEPSVVDSLVASIPWEELELSIVGIADNGKRALELLREQKAEIAILDIRMPGLNGLEICERMHRENEELQIILISGYAEFSYAERAIRYGVLGYCLKPLEYDQVIRFLLKAEKNLEKRYRSIPKGDLLEALERGNICEAREILQEYHFEDAEVYLAASVGEERLELPDTVTVGLGREQYGYLMKEKKDAAYWKELLCRKEKIAGFGYSDMPVSLEGMLNGIFECQTKSFQFFINPEQRLCHRTDPAKADRHMEMLRKYLMSEDFETVEKELKTLEVSGWEDFTIRHALKLCNFIHSGRLFKGEENDYYVYSLRQLTSQYRNIRRMFRELCQDIRDAKNRESQKGAAYTNTAFLEVMNYIAGNYKTDISLSSVAENCHMSTNYVSQLFKKETGINFVHYVTQLRMEEAIKLLETTRKPASEIASLVGFNDYFYFMKTFKKYTGKTLGQFRSEIG